MLYYLKSAHRFVSAANEEIVPEKLVEVETWRVTDTKVVLKPNATEIVFVHTVAEI